MLTRVGMYLISSRDETTGVVLMGTWIVLTGLGIGGTLTVVSVAVRNSAPFNLVGAGTSAEPVLPVRGRYDGPRPDGRW